MKKMKYCPTTPRSLMRKERFFSEQMDQDSKACKKSQLHRIRKTTFILPVHSQRQKVYNYENVVGFFCHSLYLLFFKGGRGYCSSKLELVK